MTGGACPLCKRVAAGGAVAANELAAAIVDAFPVSRGHLPVVPRRHVADYFALMPAEQHAVADHVPVAKPAIEQAHAPDGYNLGSNVGVADGQTETMGDRALVPRWLPVAAPVPSVLGPASRHGQEAR